MIGASRRSISSVVRSTRFLSSSLQSLSNSRSVNGSELKFSARWFSMLTATNDKFASNLCKRNIIYISSRFDSTAAAVDSSNLTGEKYEYQAELHASRELTTSSQGKSQNSIAGSVLPFRCMTTVVHLETSSVGGGTTASPDISQPQRIKFKRLDKTAKHIMNILDKEAVEKVQADREIPDIRPGYIIQLKVEVPENKRRVSILKGIVIARRNAGLNTTFRLRRLVAGVGVESVFPLYSPNIKEMKVLDKKKVRRAKLYYLRDRMNALKK